VLDAQTGQVNAGFGSHLQGCELGSPLLAGGVLYVGCSSLSTSSTVTAYGAESGAQIWEKAVNGSYVFPLGQQGNVVYVLGQYDGNANGTTTALKTSDGSILWQHTGSYITATGGVALISSGNILSALDAASGRTLWQATELGANIQALAA
jgi:outer membrane protein assembly factor BamB